MAHSSIIYLTDITGLDLEEGIKNALENHDDNFFYDEVCALERLDSEDFGVDRVGEIAETTEDERFIINALPLLREGKTVAEGQGYVVLEFDKEFALNESKHRMDLLDNLYDLAKIAAKQDIIFDPLSSYWTSNSALTHVLAQEGMEGYELSSLIQELKGSNFGKDALAVFTEDYLQVWGEASFVGSLITDISNMGKQVRYLVRTDVRGWYHY